jgi:hypothetical protein
LSERIDVLATGVRHPDDDRNLPLAEVELRQLLIEIT